MWTAEKRQHACASFLGDLADAFAAHRRSRFGNYQDARNTEREESGSVKRLAGGSVDFTGARKKGFR
jgi:hypothetical protein